MSFDAGYYRRFYRDAPVHGRVRVGHLAAGVAGLMGWWGLPLRSVLDVGAGPGFWRDWFARERPAVRYRSVDVSRYACERYGHEHRDIAAWRPPGRYDLVVCQGVLQYLDDGAVGTALEHLAGATRGLLYLEVPTAADRDGLLDHDRSDLDCHWRTGRWYRRRVERHYVQVGAGLWSPRERPLAAYELEVPPLRSPG